MFNIYCFSTATIVTRTRLTRTLAVLLISVICSNIADARRRERHFRHLVLGPEMTDGNKQLKNTVLRRGNTFVQHQQQHCGRPKMFFSVQSDGGI